MLRHALLLAFALSAGCFDHAHARYSATVAYSSPELVAVAPGVQVIADYDQPVFYSDNYYWRYDNGVWYRSRDYRRDWARIEVVPDRIRTIERPEMSVHSHGEAHANAEQPYVAPEVREEVVTPQPAPVVNEQST